MERVRLIRALVIVLGLVSAASASVWTNATGNQLFSDAGNWDNGVVPIYGNQWAEVYIPGGPIVDYDAGAYGLVVDTDMLIKSGGGRLSLRAGAFIGTSANVNGAVTVEPGADLMVNFGSVSNATFKHLSIGDNGSTGTLHNYGRVELGDGNDLYMGKDTSGTSPGTGILNLYDGSYFRASEAYLGWGSSATVNIYGGQFVVDGGSSPNLTFYLGGGSQGSAVLNMLGGELSVPNGRLNLSHNAGSTGHVQLDNGKITVNDIWEWDGDGSMDITGGELWVGSSRLGRVNSYVAANIITAYGGTGTVVVEDIDGVWTRVTAVPEPGTLALLGLAALGLRRRRG